MGIGPVRWITRIYANVYIAHGLAVTTVSNLNLSGFELDLGLGFDNIDDIEFVLVGGWGGVVCKVIFVSNPT